MAIKPMKLKPQQDKKKKILERAIEGIVHDIKSDERRLANDGDPQVYKGGGYFIKQILSLFGEKLQEERERVIEEIRHALITNALAGHMTALDVLDKLKSEEEHDY